MADAGFDVNQFYAGASTGGNTAGTTGTVYRSLILAGGNNITLSQSAVGGMATVTISGGNAGGGGSNTIGMSNIGNTSGTTGVVSDTAVRFLFAGGNNITLSQSLNGASGTLTISAFNQTVESQSAGISNLGNTSGTSGIASGAQVRFLLAGGNNVTLSQSVNGASATVTISAFTQSVQTQMTGLTAGISTGGNTSGTTGLVSNRLVFVGGNNITLSQSVDGQSATLTISAPNLGGGAVNFSAGTTSNNLGSVVFSNSNGVSFGLNGSTITASVNAAGGGATISSYENMVPGALNTTQSVGQSTSMAIAFQIPQAISFSYLRLPVSMTTRSTTISTSAAGANMSCSVVSTVNAVIYSLGVGGNSRSLQSVASGSAGFTWLNSQSVAANGTQGSYTQAFSAQAEGAGTTLTTQYSISNTNYSWVSTAIHGSFSGGRLIDIPFNNSLSAGPYWIVFGVSTSSASNSARIGGAISCCVSYSNHFGQGQSNIAIGVMGSSNMTSAQVGVGSFSTAGGGTTASLPLSAISSSASHVKPYFQLIRQA